MKGGVGKTTLTANLAGALAHYPEFTKITFSNGIFEKIFLPQKQEKLCSF